ncbi:MAG: hypothetical protein ACK4V2_03140 [Pseudomonadota bacterium]|jgi:hypothetical protein|nr:hypothetical protein [Alphaproteobacteria bacterium]
MKKLLVCLIMLMGIGQVFGPIMPSESLQEAVLSLVRSQNITALIRAEAQLREGRLDISSVTGSSRIAGTLLSHFRDSEGRDQNPRSATTIAEVLKARPDIEAGYLTLDESGNYIDRDECLRSVCRNIASTISEERNRALVALIRDTVADSAYKLYVFHDLLLLANYYPSVEEATTAFSTASKSFSQTGLDPTLDTEALMESLGLVVIPHGRSLFVKGEMPIVKKSDARTRDILKKQEEEFEQTIIKQAREEVRKWEETKGAGKIPLCTESLTSPDLALSKRMAEPIGKLNENYTPARGILVTEGEYRSPLEKDKRKRIVDIDTLYQLEREIYGDIIDFDSLIKLRSLAKLALQRETEQQKSAEEQVAERQKAKALATDLLKQIESIPQITFNGLNLVDGSFSASTRDSSSDALGSGKGEEYLAGK